MNGATITADEDVNASEDGVQIAVRGETTRLADEAVVEVYIANANDSTQPIAKQLGMIKMASLRSSGVSGLAH